MSRQIRFACMVKKASYKRINTKIFFFLVAFVFLFFWQITRRHTPFNVYACEEKRPEFNYFSLSSLNKYYKRKVFDKKLCVCLSVCWKKKTILNFFFPVTWVHHPWKKSFWEFYRLRRERKTVCNWIGKMEKSSQLTVSERNDMKSSPGQGNLSQREKNHIERPLYRGIEKENGENEKALKSLSDIREWKSVRKFARKNKSSPLSSTVVMVFFTLRKPFLFFFLLVCVCFFSHEKKIIKSTEK